MISTTKNFIIAGFTYIYPRKGEIRFCFRVFVLEPLEKHWFEGLRSDKNIKIILYINFYFIWLWIHDSSNVVDFRHLKFDKNLRKTFQNFENFNRSPKDNFWYRTWQVKEFSRWPRREKLFYAGIDNVNDMVRKKNMKSQGGIWTQTVLGPYMI